MAPTPIIKTDALVKRFTNGAGATVTVLDGVTFDLGRGETIALTGESGSGKSTLLHLAGGLDAPDTGTVFIDGTDVTSLNDAGRAEMRRTKIGIVFQQFNLIPSLTAGQNLAFQSRLAGQYDPEWCAHLADRLGLIEHLDNYPEQLSGGQQQRVAIGRALAPRPVAVLADEPTGNLDEATSGTVMQLMLDLVEETDAALLMVTHSKALAICLARQLHLSHGKLQ